MLEGTTNKFIVIEGIDKSGKSTLCRNLKEELMKRTKQEIILTGFPNRKSITGKIIDQYLNEKVSLNAQTIHLLFSANRWEEVDFLKNLKNKIIICDRYHFSGTAYTSAKGVSLDWAKKSDEGLPVPDLVVFLDIDAASTAKRSGYGDEKYDDISFQERCYNILYNLVKDHPNGLIVDGNLDPKILAATLAEKILHINKN